MKSSQSWDDVAREVSILTDPTGQLIDEGIKLLIIGLRCFGIPTFSSCSGHTDSEVSTSAWVDVIDQDDDLREQAYEYLETYENMTEILTAHPEIAAWREKNYAAYGKVIDLLDEFYADRQASADQRIVLSTWDPFGCFRMECQGAELQPFRSEDEQETYLAKYQKEMNDFALFLKVKVGKIKDIND